MKIKILRGNEIPEVLREIPQPPKRLHLLGNLPDRDKFKYIAVVGSRKISHYGEKVIGTLINELRGYNVAIISGLALGADTLAHKLAIENNLPTFAVLGSGLSKTVLYPKSNHDLALEIVRSGGALLSEFDFKQPATVWTFPQRNRIMAGIADATLVIEAGLKSGTMITAKLALEYNRDVMTVPGNMFDSDVQGNIRLIKMGAYAVTSGEDILHLLGIKTGTQTAIPENLPQNEQKILKTLLKTPLPKETLMDKVNMNIHEFHIALSKLEIRGYVEERLGCLTLKL